MAMVTLIEGNHLGTGVSKKTSDYTLKTALGARADTVVKSTWSQAATS